MIDFIRSVWRKNVAGKVQLIVTAAIFLGVVVVLPYAIVTRPGDLAFLKTENGDDYRWKRSNLPLTCFYDHAELPERFLRAYDVARRKVAEATNAELLGPCLPWSISEPMPDHLSGSITLRLRREPPEHAGADTVHRYDRRDGTVLSACVSFDADLGVDVLDRVVLHELGHVLGLDHDRERGSIMYPTLAWRSAKLSRRDVAALRRVYGTR